MEALRPGCVVCPSCQSEWFVYRVAAVADEETWARSARPPRAGQPADLDSLLAPPPRPGAAGSPGRWLLRAAMVGASIAAWLWLGFPSSLTTAWASGRSASPAAAWPGDAVHLVAIAAAVATVPV